MKRNSVYLLLALCMLLLCACGGGEKPAVPVTEVEAPSGEAVSAGDASAEAAPNAEEQAANVHTIYVLLDEAASSASVRMALGAQEYAAFSGMTIAVRAAEGNGDAESAALVREALLQKPEALCIALCGGEETEKALGEACDMGVKVIACTPTENVDAVILPVQGELYGAAVMDALAAPMNESGSYAILPSSKVDAYEIAMAQGALAHQREVYADMRNVETDTVCGADSETAYEAVKALLQKEERPDGLLLTTVEGMRGAGRAVDELGLSDSVCVAGVGLPSENMGLLQNGFVDAFVSSDPSLSIQAACALARRMLENAEVGAHTDLGVIAYNDLCVCEPNVFAGSNFTIVTAENAAGLGY